MKSSFVNRAIGIREGGKEELGKRKLEHLFPKSGMKSGGEKAKEVRPNNV